MNVNRDAIFHKQSQAFIPSFIDYEECILREREKSIVKLCKNCIPVHNLTGECQLLWETDRTNFNHHEVSLFAT